MSDLCVGCILVVGKPSAHITLQQWVVGGTDSGAPESNIQLHTGGCMYNGIVRGVQIDMSHHLAGRPEEFARFARMLAAIFSDQPIIWRIDSVTVGVFAEMTYFGMRICIEHLAWAQQSYEKRVKW